MYIFMLPLLLFFIFSLKGEWRGKGGEWWNLFSHLYFPSPSPPSKANLDNHYEREKGREHAKRKERERERREEGKRGPEGRADVRPCILGSGFPGLRRFWVPILYYFGGIG
eukprot:91915-Amorphochlora_amoeboformis.AAC.1